jgi:hypothetical protein
VQAEDIERERIKMEEYVLQRDREDKQMEKIRQRNVFLERKEVKFR